MAESFRAALNHAINDELDAAYARIAHCLSQLRDDQVWWEPPHQLNPIGNLLLHLIGNVKQLIVDHLMGIPDTRNRPAEFTTREPIPPAELLRRLKDVLEQAKHAIGQASDRQLMTPAHLNNQNWTSGLQAVIRSVAHFRGHTQEIIHMTRELLGEQYVYAGPK